MKVSLEGRVDVQQVQKEENASIRYRSLRVGGYDKKWHI
jgi:hypothetical protein